MKKEKQQAFPKEKKAVIYARQSSGNDDYSESVAAQITNCHTLAKKEGLEVVGIYKDLNTSGETYPVGAENTATVDKAYLLWLASQKEKKGFRSGLGDLIQRIEKGDIEVVIVNEMTRLYRPVSNSFLETYINNIFREHGIVVAQVQGGKIDLAQFDQHLIAMIKNQILFEDLQKKKQNSIIGFNRKRDSGMKCSKCGIFGTEYLGNGKIRMLPDYVPVIKFIFQGILNYRSYNSIIRDCNKKFAKLNRIFYPSTLYHIGRQPFYAGYQYDTSGKLIKNIQITGQEVISISIWRKAQEILDAKRQKAKGRSTHNWYPLSSRLFCHNCGGHLSIGQSMDVHHYSCRKSNFSGNWKCRESFIRYDPLKDGSFGLFDSTYPLLLIGMIATYEETKEMRKIVRAKLKYRKELAALADRESFVVKLCEEKCADESKIRNTLKRINEKKVKLSIALAEAETMPIKEFRRFASYWHYVKRIEKRDLKQTLYEDFVLKAGLTATVYPDKVEYHTIAGDFTIPRVFYLNRKNMPEWTIEVKRPMLERNPISIVYHADTGKRTKVLSWKNLRIYVC